MRAPSAAERRPATGRPCGQRAASRPPAGVGRVGPHREREGGSASRRRSPRSAGFATALERTGTGYAARAGRERGCRGCGGAVGCGGAGAGRGPGRGRRAEGESGLTAAMLPHGHDPPGARPAARVTNAQRHGGQQGQQGQQRTSGRTGGRGLAGLALSPDQSGRGRGVVAGDRRSAGLRCWRVRATLASRPRPRRPSSAGQSPLPTSP